MKDNTVTAYNGSEIYANEILSFADDYVDTLNKPEDIYKKQCFAGMIKYISTRIRDRINNYYSSIYIYYCIYDER